VGAEQDAFGPRMLIYVMRIMVGVVAGVAKFPEDSPKQPFRNPLFEYGTWKAVKALPFR